MTIAVVVNDGIADSLAATFDVEVLVPPDVDANLPITVYTSEDEVGNATGTATLNASTSTDPDSNISDYNWVVGNTEIGTTATDPSDNSKQESLPVTVEDTTAPTFNYTSLPIAAGDSSATYTQGETISFTITDLFDFGGISKIELEITSMFTGNMTTEDITASISDDMASYELATDALSAGDYVVAIIVTDPSENSSRFVDGFLIESSTTSAGDGEATDGGSADRAFDTTEDSVTFGLASSEPDNEIW